MNKIDLIRAEYDGLVMEIDNLSCVLNEVERMIKHLNERRDEIVGEMAVLKIRKDMKIDQMEIIAEEES